MTTNRIGRANGEEETPFPLLKFVSGDTLAERLQEVKPLGETEHSLYRLVKDAASGEHYLHYAARHLNIAGGGAEEHYHHLLPLGSDDVIAIALGEPWPVYPDEWRSAYLRNGPNGGYVWYDPDGAAGGSDDAAGYEAAALALREKLLAFRREGGRSEADLQRLLDETEGLFPRREPNGE
ncbi:hypothetical protein [Cohnella nanjingensis]|uniref:Uncharacterized protein n=1 Tax=Cohnella nanjingensis TaxID=1387779 RepID=A0A7X0VCR8_9BACL|nr:hypothetical protein [Cohnella nanjingensis]MBB6669190.1 hypothetical protein [Cohnella nanjingensis]